jgi:putative FmdB family regulatory protein
MPTYDYLCENCGYEFEQFQTITAKPVRRCPNCGKAAVKRLIGVGAGVIFKGSGFYQTDYRSESYKKAAESENKGSDKKKKEIETPGIASKAKARTETSTETTKKSARPTISR